MNRFAVNFFALVIMILITACPSSHKDAETQALDPIHKIRVYTLDWHQDSGFITAVASEFERNQRCSVEVVTFKSTADLIAAIESASPSDSIDIVLGLDNTFAISADLSSFFITEHGIVMNRIERRIRNDAEPFMIPYAHGNLALLYNDKVIADPPRTFGELQDSRFMNQLITLDPSRSGIGRSHLFWTIALFGQNGFEQLWGSLRKNVYRQADSWNEGIEMLQKGQAGLMIGFSGTAIWLSERQPSESRVKVSRFKEGSFQYVEFAAIHRNTPYPVMARKFVEHLIDPVTQLHTLYKLGLFPANEATTMPVKFSTVPFTSYVLNDRLVKDTPRENIETWLNFWERLFSYSFVRSRPPAYRAFPT